MIINSVNNKHIKNLKKLSVTKYQKQNKLFIIEGKNLVTEALNYSEPVEVLATEKYLNILPSNINFTLINDKVAKYLSSTTTTEGIFAIISFEGAVPKFGKWIVLDGLQDPGNVGTILRTADFFGYDGVFFSSDTVSPYLPKSLRAAQGSNFHLQVVMGDILSFMEKLHEWKIPILGTKLHQNATPVSELKSLDNHALILGNEGRGLSEAVSNTIDENIVIPALGNAESLNVSIAASILMYALNIKKV